MRDAVATLCAELARLGVDPSTIDELADHYATTIEHRLAAGDTLDAAIATGRARLGDLDALAREHAKVSSRFGARPPRATAWIVAAAMLWWPWLMLFHSDGSAPLEHTLPMYLLGFGMLRTLAIAGLVLRLPPAAALVQGFAACELLVVVANLDYANLGQQLQLTTLALLAISAGSCVLLSTRFTTWRGAMVALGFLVPTGILGVGGPAEGLLPVSWLIATTLLAVRARGATIACAALMLVVLVETREHLSLWLLRVERFGFQPWQPIDLAATIAVVAGSVLAVVVARRCNRPWSEIVDELRPHRAPDAPV